MAGVGEALVSAVLKEVGKISSSVAKFSMGRKLKNVREKLTNIAAQRSQFGFMLDTCSTHQVEINKRQTTSKINRTTIVGRQKEKEEIVTLLKLDDQQETLVLPIFGFGGIGKTTLAKLVFNDDRMESFDLRITKEDTKNSMLLSMHDLIHDLARSVLRDELFFVDGQNGYGSGNGNHRFIVQRTASGMSSNISRLQSVYPAELEIECLENVKSIKEVDAVNMADKSVLAKLVLAWTPAVERFVEDEALLREFLPPENLMFLKIQGYTATSFSGWMMAMTSYLPHLVCIEMVNLPRCEDLPPFGQLQNLERLTLKRMPMFRKLGTEFCGGSGAFKKLREFTLIDLDTLEEWVTKVPVRANGEFMFPSLHRLEIYGCPKLRLKPCLPRATEWIIQASDEEKKSQYDAGSSSSALMLSKLHVKSCQLLPNQWALLEFLPALEVLEISNYQQKKLPDAIGFLVSLRSLTIDVCNNDPEELSNWIFFECYNIVFSGRREYDIKQLADTLAAVGQTLLRDKEVVRFIIHNQSLSLADRNRITSITTGNDDITLYDLFAHLVTQRGAA
ncbi:hypothetical protein BAE44_0014411 [Dichanthelium oligosanthes]|uniref:Uncharacterized protein n=1 Tax=Dichanthelium oligosanthes TaxID=888268 RepID=A0A1E5VHG7_9POAL|nr:hypothetical protein BAE44_0014411 [Dichanthelium oligosanthes]